MIRVSSTQLAVATTLATLAHGALLVSISLKASPQPEPEPEPMVVLELAALAGALAELDPAAPAADSASLPTPDQPDNETTVTESAALPDRPPLEDLSAEESPAATGLQALSDPIEPHEIDPDHLPDTPEAPELRTADAVADDALAEPEPLPDPDEATKTEKETLPPPDLRPTPTEPEATPLAKVQLAELAVPVPERVPPAPTSPADLSSPPDEATADAPPPDQAPPPELRVLEAELEQSPPTPERTPLHVVETVPEPETPSATETLPPPIPETTAVALATPTMTQAPRSEPERSADNPINLAELSLPPSERASAVPPSPADLNSPPDEVTADTPPPDQTPPPELRVREAEPEQSPPTPESAPLHVVETVPEPEAPSVTETPPPPIPETTAVTLATPTMTQAPRSEPERSADDPIRLAELTLPPSERASAVPPSRFELLSPPEEAAIEFEALDEDGPPEPASFEIARNENLPAPPRPAQRVHETRPQRPTVTVTEAAPAPRPPATTTRPYTTPLAAPRRRKPASETRPDMAAMTVTENHVPPLRERISVVPAPPPIVRPPPAERPSESATPEQVTAPRISPRARQAAPDVPEMPDPTPRPAEPMPERRALALAAATPPPVADRGPVQRETSPRPRKPREVPARAPAPRNQTVAAVQLPAAPPVERTAPTSLLASAPVFVPRPAFAAPMDSSASREYAGVLYQRLNKSARRSYPKKARDLGEEGTVPLRLTVAPEGRLLAVDVTDRSQAPNRLIDAAVLAVRQSAPFPSFAPEMGARPASFTVQIHYRLR